MLPLGLFRRNDRAKIGNFSYVQVGFRSFSNFASRNNPAMDTPKVLTQADTLDIVREYKQAIAPLFSTAKSRSISMAHTAKGTPILGVTLM